MTGVETGIETGVDERLAWWRARLADLPTSSCLPAADGSAGAPSTFEVDGEPDADGLGVVVAGLLTRYASALPSPGVVVCVGAQGRWLPVAVDLRDDPTRAVAAARWAESIAAARDHDVEFGELGADAACAPALLRAVVAVDGTAWTLGRPDLVVSAGRATASVTADHPRVAGHLQALVAGWTGSIRLAAVDILGAEERAELMRGAAGPVRPVPAQTVWDLVREQIASAPGAVAVVDDAGSVTYAALGERVERVAGRLAEHGVRPGGLVGLAIGRGIDMVVGLLAIMRTGAAYVPIDPDYPADRIAMMLADAAIGAVLTDPASDGLDVFAGLDRVRVDAPGPGDTGDPGDPGDTGDTGDAAQLPSPDPDGLAYVIFTSGSTGRPKGVQIGHRALTNFVLSMSRAPGLSAADRLLGVTTLSFDIAALELLVPLAVGGCVVVPGRATLLDPHALARRIERERVSVMQATPATWQMLVDSGWAGDPDLRALCGGEALPAALRDALMSRCGQLWNMYGPTETTIWSLVTRLAADGAVTIGAPIDNTVVHLAGAHAELLPAGVAGELLIGGAGLAEGYLGRPDLTAQRFVPDRIGGTGGSLYRTGDLVRRGAGGALEFAGRLDSQVKVRGFRIELGEVEAALDERPEVRRAVAVVRPDERTGANRLLAYVVRAPGSDCDGRELRRWLRERLPAQMVPSAVVVLDAFPQTLNGKIDRAALPEPDPIAVAGDHVAARTPTELRLAAIWQEVLGIETVGMTDNVFELGADSLITARLYAEVSRRLGVTLPIAAAFGAPTIEALAGLVDGARDRAAHDGSRPPASFRALVPIRPTGSRPPLFLVHGGAGTVLLYEPLARRLGDDQPVYAFQAVGLYGVDAPQSTVEQMAATYVAELLQVAPRGPYRIGGYCFGALVAFEMARLLQEQGATCDLLVMFNGPSPSYLKRYRPSFDRNGAVTDERGRRKDAEQFRSHLRLAWARRSGPAGFAREAVALPVSRLRRRIRRWRGAFRLRRIIVRGQPLPDRLRETGTFQRISVRAQERYRPGPWSGSALVVRAAGLYHLDDLGWGDHVRGTVEVVDVAGKQLTPRDTMTDANVAPVVAALRQRLDELDRP